MGRAQRAPRLHAASRALQAIPGLAERLDSSPSRALRRRQRAREHLEHPRCRLRLRPHLRRTQARAARRAIRRHRPVYRVCRAVRTEYRALLQRGRTGLPSRQGIPARHHCDDAHVPDRSGTSRGAASPVGRADAGRPYRVHRAGIGTIPHVASTDRPRVGIPDRRDRRSFPAAGTGRRPGRA